MGARGADLGSLLGVCLGSWGGRLPAAAQRRKIRTHLERQARFAQKAAPVCARCLIVKIIIILLIIIIVIIIITVIIIDIVYPWHPTPHGSIDTEVATSYSTNNTINIKYNILQIMEDITGISTDPWTGTPKQYPGPKRNTQQ